MWSSDGMAPDRNDLLVQLDTPVQEAKAEHDLDEFSLLSHLSVQAEQFRVDPLNSLAMAVFCRPCLPTWPKALVGLSNLGMVVQRMFPQGWCLSFLEFHLLIRLQDAW